MEITIKGNAKELADLVLAIQNQLNSKLPNPKEAIRSILFEETHRTGADKQD